MPMKDRERDQLRADLHDVRLTHPKRRRGKEDLSRTPTPVAQVLDALDRLGITAPPDAAELHQQARDLITTSRQTTSIDPAAERAKLVAALVDGTLDVD